jgi:hypothetical protein
LRLFFTFASGNLTANLQKFGDSLAPQHCQDHAVANPTSQPSNKKAAVSEILPPFKGFEVSEA